MSEAKRAVVFQRDGKQLDEVAVVDFEVHHENITEVTVHHADTYEFNEFWGDL